MGKALSHLHVIELGEGISAAYCCKLLADLGADVIKVEAPGGDCLRNTGSFPLDPDDASVGCLFRYLNTNKRSVEMNLSEQGGIDAFKGLVAGADLVVENLGAGVLEGLGLDPDKLAKVNHNIAVVRIADFGQEGPYINVPATDLTVQASAAWISRHQSTQPKPSKAGGLVGDYVTGVHAACGGLTSVRTARELGEKVVVDVSKQECLLGTLPQPAFFFETLQSLGMGIPEDRIFPVPGAVRCKDGYVAVNVLTAQQFADCCTFMGVPEYIPKQMELNVAGPELERFYEDIKPWLMERTAEEIVELCQAVRIPAVPIGNGQNLPEMAQLKSRGFFIRDPEDQFIQPSFPFLLEKTPASLRTRAPRLGEHRGDIEGNPWSGERRESSKEVSSREGTYLPFEGLRVIDMGTFWAGPLVGCYLGAMGADVIKVESIQRPDGFRYSMSYPQQGDKWYELGGGYQGSNLNKRNITLDLNQEKGKVLMERLLAGSDIVIENFSARVMDNFGLSVEHLREINPRLIVVRMPAFGLSGPWKDYVGWGMAMEQASGMAWLTGDPDYAPLALGGVADPVVSMHGLVAVQAALEYRDITGEGQVVEVSQLEACTCTMAEQVIAYSVTGRVQTRNGNRSEIMSPEGVYLSADNRWVAISIRNDEEWDKLVGAMGSPSWAEDPGLKTFEGRMERHDQIDEGIGEWAGAANAEEIVEKIRAQGIPACKVLGAHEMYSEPHLSARRFYQELEHPILGMRRYPRIAIVQYPGTGGMHCFGAPTLGQHNREILESEFNLSADEIAEMEKGEIIGNVPKGMA
ncbi:MAG: CoA transferase [Dehalococcoidia bacterium]